MPRDEGSLFGLSQRLPPFNAQAEQALIGAVFANNAAYFRVSEFLRSEHFYDPIHARIWQAIERTIKGGHLADAVTLKAEFEHTGVLEEAGGTAYLAQLLTAMVGILNAGEYGRAIHDTWLRRQLVSIGEDVVNNAFGADAELDGPQQIQQASAQLGTLLSQTEHGSGVRTLGEAAAAYITGREAAYRGEPLAGVKCGFLPVDHAFGNFLNGRLYMLGGAPGSGKTALAQQIAEGAAAYLLDELAAAPAFSGRGGYVWLSSQEMDAEELGGRSIASGARISSNRLDRAQELSQDDWDAMFRAQKRAAGLPVLINDHSGITAQEAILMVQAEMSRRRVRLAIFDHLHKFKLDHKSMGSGGTLFALRQAASDLKDGARRLGIPFLVLGHLTRENAKRANPRPLLEDFAYAGIGDADVVALMWRPEDHMGTMPEHVGKESEEGLQRRKEEWRQKKERLANKIELIVAKRRGGPKSVTLLEFSGETTSFGIPGLRSDMVNEEDIPI